MASPYKLYGGATRSDAISGLNPGFSAALEAMYRAAPPEVQAELGLNSAYRDRATQTRLFNASDRSGRTVARPGHSRHEKGEAADLYGFGLKGGGNVSQATKDWVRQNAGQYGLEFPMDYEPWHVQMRASGGAASPTSSPAAAPVAWTINPEWPAGMRNNNPGNIKFIGQSGTHPSQNTDQGDPQAVYASPEAGMQAMYQLLMKKYQGGKVTPNMIIASQGGWTPGNTQAAANVAKYAGIGPDDDIGMADPAKASKFMRALMLQEHGAASKAYTDAMITGAISGKTPASPQRPADQFWQGVSRPDDRSPYKLGGAFAGGAGGGAGKVAGTGGTADTVKREFRKQRGLDALKGMAKGLGGLGGGGGWQMPQLEAEPEAARVDAPVASVFDPQAADTNRQQLAALLARLNSGGLA